jgi:hypothetical protein
VRTVLCVVIGMAALGLTRAADDAPTPVEQKAIDALTRLGGTASVNPNLHQDARVAVRFKELTDATLAALKKHPQVGAVETFDSTKCTDKGLAALADLPHLRQLKLGQNAATDKTLAVIAECKQLRLLYVGQARITDAGLEKLKPLTRLEALDVSGSTKVTDAGMAHVKTLERLEVLGLANTAITDKGLYELAPLEGLRSLDVRNTKVTADAALKFPDMMPNLRAVRH